MKIVLHLIVLDIQHLHGRLENWDKISNIIASYRSQGQFQNKFEKFSAKSEINLDSLFQKKSFFSGTNWRHKYKTGKTGTKMSSTIWKRII